MDRQQPSMHDHLVLTDVNKSYPSADGTASGFPVLESVTMTVHEGEFTTLFGPNGCGKSTLLHIVAGILKADSGSVTIGGKLPEQAKIGFVLQNYRDSLFPWRTACENIAFPLELRGIPKARRRAQVHEAVERFGLNIPLDHYPYQLSGGQQQLTAITRALIEKPDVLLMDEPFSALDYQTRIFMQERLQHIWKTTHATVLFVSHEIDEALLLADRLILLSQRPVKVLEIVRVDIGRPREHRIVASSRFLEIKRQVLEVIGEALCSKNTPSS